MGYCTDKIGNNFVILSICGVNLIEENSHQKYMRMSNLLGCSRVKERQQDPQEDYFLDNN